MLFKFKIFFILFFTCLSPIINAKSLMSQEIRVNDDIDSTDQIYPDFAINMQDELIIVWQDFRNTKTILKEGDIFCQLLTGELVKRGTNFKINDNYLSASFPSLDVDSIGNFIVSYEFQYFEQFYSKYQYLPVVRKFNKNGSAFSRTQGLGVTASENPSHPFIVFNNSGIPMITWSERVGLGYKYSIYFHHFDFIDHFKVNDRPENKPWFKNKDYPKISVDSNGNFAIVWHEREGEENLDYDILCQHFDMNGNFKGDNFVVNDTIKNSNQIFPDLDFDQNGNLLIVWQDNRDGNWDIYLQRYNNQGENIGNNFKVNSDISGNSHTKPSVDVGKDGKFIICWENHSLNNSTINKQLFNQNGEVLGKNNMVTSQYSSVYSVNPKVKIHKKNAYYLWESNIIPEYKYDIYVKVEDIVTNVDNSEANKKNEHKIIITETFMQNYPNPFNTETVINYKLPFSSNVTFEIYNLNGYKIRTLLNNQFIKKGYHKIKWDGIDQIGNRVVSGIYILFLNYSTYYQTSKMILVY